MLFGLGIDGLTARVLPEAFSVTLFLVALVLLVVATGQLVRRGLRSADGGAAGVHVEPAAEAATSASASGVAAVGHVRREASAAEPTRMREISVPALLQALPDPVLLVRHDAVVLDAHVPAGVDWLRPAPHLIGQSLRTVLPEGPADQLVGLVSDRRRRSPVTLERSWPHAAGTPLDVEVRLTPCDEHTWHVTLRNISARKSYERELAAERESAESRLRNQGEFLARITHDLRTPLAGIIGMVDLLLDTELSPQQQDPLTSMRRSAEAMLLLTSDLLDYARMEANKLALELVPFGLRDYLFSFTDELVLLAEQKGLELVVSMPPEIPEMLIGDPGRLRQIIVNLVGNAVKFTDEGEVVIGVQELERDTDHVILEVQVRDTGIGVSPKQLEAIFEPFEQADETISRIYGGTGLGLAISKQLVEKMHGRIWVESEPGGGSTFHFTARFRLAERDTTRLRPAQPERIAGKVALLAVASETSRSFLHQLLADWQLEVLDVGSQEELEAAVRAEGAPLDVVLLDANLLELDRASNRAPSTSTNDEHGGDSASEAWLTELLQMPRAVDAAVLMLTQHGQQFDPVRAEQWGVEGMLTKPVKPALLLRAITTALGLKPMSLRLKQPGGRSRRSMITRHSLRKHDRQLHVLVAEDDAVNRKLVVRTLEKRGHQVSVALTGSEAVEALVEASDSRRYDAVLMDIEMPELDGLEATRKIRQWETSAGREGIPIVAMSAHVGDEERERATAAGMSAYLAKPVRAEELFDLLDSLLPIGHRTGVHTIGTSERWSAPDAKQLERMRSESNEGMTDLRHALGRVEGDQELTRELLDVFLTEVPVLISRLGEAQQAGDTTAAHELSTALVTAVRPYAPAAAEVARELEAAAGREDLDELAGHFKVFCAHLRPLKSAFSALAAREVH